MKTAQEMRSKTAMFAKDVVEKIEAAIETAAEQGLYETRIEFNEDAYDREKEIEVYKDIIRYYFKELGFKVYSTFPAVYISWEF